MATIGSVPASSGPVLTDGQAKILNTLKSIARTPGDGAKRTTAQAVDAVRINLPALQLAAGSARATGDLRGARYVAGQTKALADDLRSALKNAGAAPTGDSPGPEAPTAKEIATIAKQLKTLLVKARIALLQPQTQQSNPAARRAAESEVRNSETSLKALEAQIGGARTSGVDIHA
jgi:hypothetical protein